MTSTRDQVLDGLRAGFVPTVGVMFVVLGVGDVVWGASGGSAAALAIGILVIATGVLLLAGARAARRRSRK